MYIYIVREHTDMLVNKAHWKHKVPLCIIHHRKMKLFASILLMSCLAAGIFLMSIFEPEDFFGIEYEVRVINGFTNNSSLPLVIWCSSEDSDLGGRALQEGDDFGWRLKTNVWGSTRYLCTMKWDATRRRFDAFKVPRDSHRCAPFKKCSWLVKEDGFYFSSDEVNWKKDFSWY